MACPKCSGEMEVGHIPDATYGGYVPLGWFAGVPEKSIWKGMKLDEKKRTPITAHRCAKCGFLELYAKPAT